MTTSEAWKPLDGLSSEQLGLLSAYERLLASANRKRNLVSKASAGEIRERHIMHSLSLSIREFPAGSRVVDWGTGGGLPGIPLAIRFPDVTFHLVDSIFKKTWTVAQFVSELGLSNVHVHQMRAEEWSQPVDFAVSRATASLSTLWEWTEPNLSPPVPAFGENQWCPGLIALKGGDLRAEIVTLVAANDGLRIEEISLIEAVGSSAGADKWLIHVSRDR